MVRCAEVRVLVVAPVGLHPHWRREADAVGLSLQLVSWARLPDALPAAGTLLVVDEAHYAQSIKAQRTAALLRLARHPRLRAIWMLTGTPMKNGRPSQLFPLLAAIELLLENRSRGQRKFPTSRRPVPTTAGANPTQLRLCDCIKGAHHPNQSGRREVKTAPRRDQCRDRRLQRYLL